MTNTPYAAPSVTLPVSGGGTLSLEDLRPSKVVLFFYPKDNTPGCTKEAIGFSQLLAEFEAAGTKVIGISKDSIKKHDNFIAKQSLTVPLLSDENDEVSEAFDVWKEKSMYGKTYMGIERSTFLIDGTGQVVREWRKVKVPGHVEEVLEAAKAL
jgi:peroxiredoxin Q/BCP